MSPEQIKTWDQELRAGKSVKVAGSDLDKATVIAIVRRIRGVGADQTDRLGGQAMALVEQVLA